MKRSCRRNDIENRIHKEAGRIRRMTDTQLVKYIEEHSTNKKPSVDIPGIMEKIEGVKGIGKTKLHYIQVILESELEEANA
ncbi:MAG: hypothetical protein K6E62_00270 [Lachnospiraceae bacterium]|nr:hypothetical protein [Lachnospiraceae bacterium]